MSQFLIKNNDVLQREGGGVLLESTASGPTIDLSDAQTLHLKMNDPAANTTVKDEVGTFASGQLVTDVNTNTISTAGKINEALDLTSNHWIQGTNKAALDTSVGAVATWLKAAPNAGFYLGLGNSSQNGFAIRAAAGSYNYIDVVEQNTSNRAYYNYTFDSNWHHIVCQNDGTGLELYLDGTQRSWTGNNFGASFWINSISVYYTYTYVGTWRNDWGHHQNEMDDFRILNRVLTQDEIDFLYNSGSGTEADHN